LVTENDRAYLDALKMLARRELSEAQVRQRLARKAHDAPAIDRAVARLRDERALDDNRVAEAIARRETALRRRGKARVRMAIQRAGISGDLAKRIVERHFEAIDDDALIEAALNKRLRGRDAIADDKEFQRLYRFLAGQGFETEQIIKVLERRRRMKT
jgi:regulatory protein